MGYEQEPVGLTRRELILIGVAISLVSSAAVAHSGDIFYAINPEEKSSNELAEDYLQYLKSQNNPVFFLQGTILIDKQLTPSASPSTNEPSSVLPEESTRRITNPLIYQIPGPDINPDSYLAFISPETNTLGFYPFNDESRKHMSTAQGDAITTSIVQFGHTERYIPHQGNKPPIISCTVPNLRTSLPVGVVQKT